MGAPDRVYEQPADRFVAGFLGAVNLFAARVIATCDGVLSLDSAEAGGRLSVAHERSLAVGTEIALALRPEKIALKPVPDPRWANALTGTVRGVAYRGEASDIEVELASGKLVRVTLANAERHNPSPVTLGQRVALGFACDAGVALER